MYLWVALSLLIVSQGTLVLCSSYWHLQKDRDSVSVVSPFLPLMVPNTQYPWLRDFEIKWGPTNCTQFTTCEDCSLYAMCFYCDGKCTSTPASLKCSIGSNSTSLGGWCNGAACDCRNCRNRIFPCSDSIGASIFLIITYSVFMAIGSKLIGDGVELLLELFPKRGSTVVANFVGPVLTIVPLAAVTFVGGFGSTSDINSQFPAVLGTIAGVSGLCLNLLWALLLWRSRCDFNHRGEAIDGVLTSFSLTTSGVTLDSATTSQARLMLISTIPFLVAQGPAFMYLQQPLAQTDINVQLRYALAASVICFVFFALYGIFNAWNGKYATQLSIVASELKEDRQLRERVYSYVEKVKESKRESSRPTPTVAPAQPRSPQGSRKSSEARRSVDLQTAPDGASDPARQSMVTPMAVATALRGNPIVVEEHEAEDRSEARRKKRRQRGRKSLDGAEESSSTNSKTGRSSIELRPERMSTDSADGDSLLEKSKTDTSAVVVQMEPRRRRGRRVAFEDNDIPEEPPSQPGSKPSVASDPVLPSQQAPIDSQAVGPRHASRAVELVQIDDTSLQSLMGGSVLSFKATLIKAIILLVVGIALSVVFADPIILVLSDLGVQFRASPFYVGYGLAPISVSFYLIWRVWKVGARKHNNYTAMLYAISPFLPLPALLLVMSHPHTLSFTRNRYKQLYSTAILANTVCLGIFFVSSFVQKVLWTWSAETLVVVFSALVPGLVGSFRRTMPFWLCIPFLALYPVAYIFFKILEETAKWT